jgi:membrane fusion protein (multidrug efflux system)
VTSKISERVAGIYVDTNQEVHKGQLLVALDDRDERSRLQQAQAAVTAQRAQAAAAQSNVALTQQTVAAQAIQGLGGIAQAQSGAANASATAGAAQAAVVAAQAGVPAAQQALSRAQADYNRTQSLVSTGDIPRAQLSAAQAQAGSGAQGALQTAQGRYQESTAPARLAASQAQANAAYANVGSLQAQLALAKDQLTETRIVSPVDGYVGEKNVDVGQTIGPGTPLMAIIPSKNIFITANYKETQIGDMRPGQPVDIKVDAYKGVTFHGHVISINPAAQNTYALVPAQNASGNFIKVTQRIPVKIGIDNPPADKPLRPGMSVETSVKVK